MCVCVCTGAKGVRWTKGSLYFFISNMFFKFLSYIEQWLIYNVELASGIRQSDSFIRIHMYLFYFKFFPHLSYHKILSIVPCAIQ